MSFPRIVRRPGRAAVSCLAVALAAATITGAAGASGAARAASMPPACQQPPPQPPPIKPTTVTTIEQAYYCVFAHYYAGPVLDDRVLLAGAFAGLTQELDRLGEDQPDATMPALTGNRDSDWAAFAAVYQRVISELPAKAAPRQQAAEATMNGMIAALDDNHARWEYPLSPPPGYKPGDAYGLGIATSPVAPLTQDAPGEALPPLYVSHVNPGSPAARAGVRPGDVITAVDGSAPFTDGQVSPGVISLLNQLPPQRQTIQVTLRWPVSGATRTVTLTPSLYPAPAGGPSVTSKLLDGDIAYVVLPGFFPGSASDVLNAIYKLQKTAALRGVVLDLRGNGGGSPAEDAQLLGAFEHGKPWSYDCTITGQCTANNTDDSTPLLHLPLVVLTDRNCASGCDAFSGAVKDLRLGTLVGTRTSGIVAGPAAGWVLDDGSELGLPAEHEVSADHELINGIGVAPDYYIPFTANDLATGRDPDIAKALSLLGG
jgi:carboxyl-terminal processing protease